jgi:mannose-6-phosphate isomerase-like protein (cupin superfamily)
MVEKTSVQEVAARLEGYFTHLPLGVIDDHSAYLSRFKGMYIMHKHDKDEMYLVLEGEAVIEFADGSNIILQPQDALVVPAGTEHRSGSDKGALVLMFKHSGMFAEY